MAFARGTRLADLQAQQVEVGRIRLGTSEKARSARGREYNKPVKLERFRLTSRSQQLIIEAAKVYGGEPQPWQPEHGAQQWEVIIERQSLAVIVPPDPCSQFYEQWVAGKCTRRCNGVRELLTEQPCPCGPDPGDKKAQGCKPTTRVSLMLAELPGIGIWRLESRGYHAATELPAVVDLLTQAGGNLPARLEMEPRTAQIPDPRDASKTVTSEFMVPVLHVEATPATIMGVISGRLALSQLPGADQDEQVPALPPGHTSAALPAAPTAPAEPQPDAEQEALRQQWLRHGWYEDKINSATNVADLGAIQANISQTDRLTPEFRDSLLVVVEQRRNQITPARTETLRDPWDEAPPPPPAPTPPATPPPAPAEPQDRNAIWTQVNQFAATKGYTMSKLKSLYADFSTGEQISSATAGDLQRFLTWMQL